MSRSIQAYAAARSSRVFAALAAAALVIAGCGGGDAPVPPPGDTSATPTSTPQSPDPNAALAGNTTSAAPTGPTSLPAVNVGDTVRTTEATPGSLVHAVGKRPIVVVLAQPKSELDSLVYGEVKAAVAAAKGARSVLFAVAAGDYETYGDVPEIVGLYAAPSVAVIDRSGRLQNQWVGYVDHGIIAQAIVRAAKAKPAKVSPTDAPPSGTTDPSAAAPASPSTDPSATAPPSSTTPTGGEV